MPARATGAEGSTRQPASPSQQPILKRQRGHCQVWWRHSIAAPQRRQLSITGSSLASGQDVSEQPGATLAKEASEQAARDSTSGTARGCERGILQ